MRKAAIALICMITPVIGRADASVEEKTQFHMEGAVGGLVNALGGRATHEGVSTTTYLKGNRKATIVGRSEKIVDLDAEKVYEIDLDRRTYTVKTFEQIRKEFEDAKKRASKSEDGSAEKPSGPEYEVEFDVKNTGQKQTINGFDAHEVVATMTVHEKGKPIEKSGGGVFTADMWLGPRMKELRELSEFDRRYFQKLYGATYSAAEMQQLASLIAVNPALGKAMKAFGDKQGSFDGTPVRTILMYESVQGTEQKPDESAAPASPLGMLRRAAQRRQASSGPQRAKLFESTTEVVKASAAVAASDVAVPAGFTAK